MTAYGGTSAGLGDLITGNETIGRFQYTVDDDSWWFSPATYVLHGLPLETRLTTELIMSFKHPDDRPPAVELLGKVAEAGEPFCFAHRIIDTVGSEHSVVIIGDTTRSTAGVIQFVRGFALDLTEGQRRYSITVGASAVRAATEHRAAIEQAKGALMLVYGINPEAAFALLQWHSQQHNAKLNQIAERLIAALQAGHGIVPNTRDFMDKLLHDLAVGRPLPGTTQPQ